MITFYRHTEADNTGWAYVKPTAKDIVCDQSLEWLIEHAKALGDLRLGDDYIIHDPNACLRNMRRTYK